ncbi:PREDICTED: GTPase Era, mitochondrial [Bactrocera latifrons]|uniref:GTPase Era, mitochondrial n=2 Tax=Bactrocera latifrons TaxID=174628 RepID=A0A0K8WKR8_BACLA|nr:PREDICTED: GTPase Era, mitochondrial [Bactrocera latifrons]
MEFLLNNFASVNKYLLRFSKYNKVRTGDIRSYSLSSLDDNSTTSQISASADTTTDLVTHGQKAQRKRTQNSLHIAVIGVPNAGKSTFINNLINHRVCPTSSKVHTTRKSSKAIYTTGQTQLVLYDTPGLVTPREIKRHNLEQSFKSAYKHAIQHADVIACMHDVSNSWTRNALHSTVIETLNEYKHLPSFLILNKIDALRSKRVLLELIRVLTNNTINTTQSVGNKHQRQQYKRIEESVDKPLANTEDKKDVSWNNFQEVFLVSSITGSGLNDIQDYLVRVAKERSWEYSKGSFTDEKPEALIVESVRARLLDYLPQEIPYNLHSAIEYFSEENGTIYASVEVTCPSTRIERLICGESNGKLKQITERVTSDLVETFGKPISFTISTRSKKTD